MSEQRPQPLRTAPMTAAEVATRLGYKRVSSFHRARGKLHTIDGMPRSVKSFGRRGYDRTQMEAWFAGRLPIEPPANDVAPVTLSTDEQWTNALLQFYRGPQ